MTKVCKISALICGLLSIIKTQISRNQIRKQNVVEYTYILITEKEARVALQVHAKCQLQDDLIGMISQTCTFIFQVEIQTLQRCEGIYWKLAITYYCLHHILAFCEDDMLKNLYETIYSSDPRKPLIILCVPNSEETNRKQRKYLHSRNNHVMKTCLSNLLPDQSWS